MSDIVLVRPDFDINTVIGCTQTSKEAMMFAFSFYMNMKYQLLLHTLLNYLVIVIMWKVS